MRDFTTTELIDELINQLNDPTPRNFDPGYEIIQEFYGIPYAEVGFHKGKYDQLIGIYLHIGYDPQYEFEPDRLWKDIEDRKFDLLKPLEIIFQNWKKSLNYHSHDIVMELKFLADSESTSMELIIT